MSKFKYQEKEKSLCISPMSGKGHGTGFSQKGEGAREGKK
jgi:hypothetical protein